MPSDSLTPGLPPSGRRPDSLGVVPAAPGLPAVAPPSGKFIVQLFLVPGLIVGVIVCFLLLFSWLFGGARSPAAFLQKLDDPNTEVRWRAAADLAQNLKRDAQLASDAGFALDLADRLDRMREASAPAERALADRHAALKPAEAMAEARKLEPERNYLQYLCACLGNFRVPAGVPALRRLVEQESGMEPAALAARRRQAVWSLADLGQNLRQFDNAKLPDQDVVLAGLDRLAELPARAEAARAMAAELRARRSGRPSALGVDKALEKTATSDDPFLRELTALALNFWSGNEAETERMEATLVKLAHDAGTGEDQFEAGADWPVDEPRSVLKSPGLRVRFNAITALARRGSSKVRIDQLEEMLDDERLRGLCVVRRPDGNEQPDEAFVIQTQLAALRAIGELHKLRPALDVTRLRTAVDRLARDPQSPVVSAAQQTLQALDSQ